MADITQDTVRRVATLAHVALPEDEVAPLTEKFRTIVDFVAQLDEVDTSSIDAMTHAQQVDTPFRDDVVQQRVDPASIVAGAPEQEDGYFVVPRVIE